jgi:probable lipoprotein NlpC
VKRRFASAMRRGALTGAILAGILFAALLSGCISSSVRYGRPVLSATLEQERRAFDSAAANIHAPVETDRLKRILDAWLGTPYRWGGMSKDGVDCSGLVCQVFQELYSIKLPRSAVDQVKIGSPVTVADARAGDLVFFRWGFFGGVDHVGICTGEGRFVHASSKHGVIESSLSDEYYRSHITELRRLFQ